MKKLLVIVALVAATPVEIAAQSNQAEQEVRTFLAAYDKAVASRDIAFLERVLPDDYVLSGERGRTANRAEMLKFYTQERDNPSYRRISLTHDNVMIRVVGNMAVVTNDYTSQVAPIETPDAEPDLFKGRHTGVFEKREGRWMVIVEQDTEQIHDDKLMERQVASAGRDYHELIKRLRSGRSYAELEESGEITKLTRVLADEFTGTSGDGAVTRKAEALQAQKSNQIVLESAELLEQSVLAIDNSAAIETGKVRYVGTDAGKRVDITQRYTATWVSWGRGWQIIAYHSSVLKGTP